MHDDLHMGKYVKDWFNRRAEDAFTHVDDSKRLFSWDHGRDSYSSFFHTGKNPAKDAGKMIGSIFKVIGLPKHIKQTPVANQVKDSLRGPAPKVHIPIGMLRDEDNQWVDDPATLDAFYGACIQNAALAAMQSDMDYKRTIQPRYGEDKKSVHNLLTSVLNTERIDKKLAERMPGYLKFVQKFKNHTYENNYEAPAEDAPAQARLLDLVVRMLRYPAHITEEEMDEFKKPIESIERMLKRRGGIPDSFSECESFGRSIAKIVYDYMEEEEPPAEGGDGEGDEDGESGDGSSSSSGSGSGEGSSGSEGSGSGSGNPKMSRDDLDKMADEMMRELMSGDEGDADDRRMMDDFSDFEDSSKEMDEELWDRMGEGKAEKGKVSFDVATPHKDQYLRDKAKIDLTKAQVLARLFARKSKDYEFVMKSMRSGRLDVGKLAEAKQHVPTIYERMGHVKTDKICVGVLIDESGSMSGHRIEKARQGAIFLNEVLKKIPSVELFIYGHTADTKGDGSTDMMIYREPGKMTDPYALGSVRAREENRDGEAILSTAARIRSKTKNAGLLFVLSDGGPCAHNYHGRSAINDVRKKVLQAEALGFQVIQIAISECVPSSEMFNHYITMTDMSTLPRDLVNYMSRKIGKLVKERVFV
jgi:cobalamin biosynthesis protein CobT